MTEPTQITDELIVEVMSKIDQRPFHTADFIDRLTSLYPETWNNLVLRYGQGGRGAGVHYSAYSAVSQALSHASARNVLDKLAEYRAAPPELNWGSQVIRYWTDQGGFSQHVFPDEVISDETDTFWEGTVISVTVNRYERDPAARAACISYFGSDCAACGIDFAAKYGPRGKTFIHVHHVVPLHTANGGYEVDPIKDLVPVCPNCHAMIHRAEPMLTVEQVRELLDQAALAQIKILEGPQ